MNLLCSILHPNHDKSSAGKSITPDCSRTRLREGRRIGGGQVAVSLESRTSFSGRVIRVESLALQFVDWFRHSCDLIRTGNYL
jgi:hypothetical protein